MIKVTTHTIVKNEENWIWYALMSVKDNVSQMLVVDDGSNDSTLQIIKSIRDPKIMVSSKKMWTPQAHTDMRNAMLAETKTDWFMILDGDEVWNGKTLKSFLAFLSAQPKGIYGVVMRTRNCIGDVYHYLPDGAGNYRLLGRKGHLTIRAFRKLPGWRWVGTDWPLEAYCDPSGTEVNNMDAHLAFFDGYYWHLTHLPRTSSGEKVLGWRKVNYGLGLPVVDKREFPEVFSLPRPSFVSSPWRKMTGSEQWYARGLTALRELRRRIRVSDK